MEEKIDKALGILLDQIRSNLKPAEALQQTQALLNMAHAKNILCFKPQPYPNTDSEPETENKTTKKQGAGS